MHSFDFTGLSRPVIAFCLLALTLLLTPIALSAQTGSITGSVVDLETGKGVRGARVRLVSADGSSTREVLSAQDGRFGVPRLPGGRFSVVVSVVGYRELRVDSLEVLDGRITEVSLPLEAAALAIDPVVVTVTRLEERAQHAPSFIAVVDNRSIEEEPSVTPMDHVIEAPGVDIARTGVMQSNLVTRGFNDIFSSSLLVLTDHRYDFLPSLRVNAGWLIPTPSEDIDRIEVQLGPGAALYGPNAAAGVLHILTKTPFAWQGTTVSVGAVARSGNETGPGDLLRRAAFRHAGLVGERLGYKVSGQFFSGLDWPHRDSVEVSSRARALQAGVAEESLLVGQRDFRAERWSAEGRVDYRFSDRMDAFVATGHSQAVSGIELTGLGAAQVRDWQLDYYHLRLRRDRLFAQAFINTSHAGDTYLLRTGTPIVDRSRMFVAQVQDARDWNRHTILYGVDAQRTEPRTGGTITGRNEAHDAADEIGAYVHVETLLTPDLDLFTAVRADHHSVLERPVLSPRAALVFRPATAHALRLTWNSAFNTPATNAFYLDAVAGTLSPLPYNVRAVGVSRDGLRFSRDCGEQLCMRSPFDGGSGSPLPIDGTRVWSSLVNLLRLIPNGADLRHVPAPTAADVRSLLRVLNPNSATFEDADPASVQDIPPLRPTLTHTLEAGYKGDLGERVRVAANVYYERRRDFIGTPVVETPSVFLATGDVNQPGTLAGYLARFLPAEEARRIALLVGGVSGSSKNPGITLGTVSPEGPYAGTDILLTYRNFGALSRWGLDGSAEIAFLDAWTVNTTFSWTTRNLFPKEEVGGLAEIALNAPKHKGSLALHYRDAERGLSGSVAGRHVDGFPMRSGVFVGTVPSYRIVDAGLAYRFGPGRAWLLSANVQNLLDERHREFVGAPALGRAAAVTLQWTTR